MNSIRISIRAEEPAQEILISQLSELGAEGFEQTGAKLIAYFPEPDFRSHDVSKIFAGFEFETGTLEEQNWNAVWESNFQPVRLDNFCSIRADFHPQAEGVEHEIVITPKMSFGTGHHATTYMMVEQMQSIDFKDRTVFDFGTGTGLLAILAENLGARRVLAIDVDGWSVENAAENMEKNKCTKINIQLSSNIPAGTFDVILANINRNVLLNYMALLKQALALGGDLLLSGLLEADEEAITDACTAQGLRLVRKGSRHGWISLLFR